MPPPSRRLNDKSLNQILTASKSSLVTAGEISNSNIMSMKNQFRGVWSKRTYND